MCSSHERTVDGTRFVGQWVLRSQKVSMTGRGEPTVPALVVPNPLGACRGGLNGG